MTRGHIGVANISIHALRKESDSIREAIDLPLKIFQSTLSVRRATDRSPPRARTRVFQSTLSVRRATILQVVTGYDCMISIHALRKESDGMRARWDVAV